MPEGWSLGALLLVALVLRLGWEGGGALLAGVRGGARLLVLGAQAAGAPRRASPTSLARRERGLSPVPGPEGRETSPAAPSETPESPGPQECPRCRGILRKTRQGWLHEANGQKTCPEPEAAAEAPEEGA